MYIKIKEIKSRYSPNIKGILHLGAHHGEEAQEYYEAGYEQVIWIEGNPDLMPQYYTVDFYASYNLIKQARIFVDIRNITDQKYFDIPGYNSRRSNYTIGVSANF